MALTRCSRSGHALLRYERGQRVAYGGALVQRHVALPQDLANKEGKGLLVRTALAFSCTLLCQSTCLPDFSVNVSTLLSLLLPAMSMW